jgi:hypothetical protein
MCRYSGTFRTRVRFSPFPFLLRAANIVGFIIVIGYPLCMSREPDRRKAHNLYFLLHINDEYQEAYQFPMDLYNVSVSVLNIKEVSSSVRQ